MKISELFLFYHSKGIDETVKVASDSIDQKMKEANTFVDTKRQDLEKVNEMVSCKLMSTEEKEILKTINNSLV